MIGPKNGETSGMRNLDDSICPENITGDWRITTDDGTTWKSDPSIKVQCFENTIGTVKIILRNLI